MCEGKREINQNNEKQEWERVRWQTWHLINTQLKKPLRTPQRLIRFEWEGSEALKDIKDKEAAFDKLKKDIEIIDRKGNWKTIN